MELRIKSNIIFYNFLAIITGILCGIIAIVFRYLISGFQYLFFDELGGLLSAFYPYYIIIIPAIGGVFVGLLTHYLAKETKGHGVPEVITAVTLHGGKIRPIVAGVKALASAISIGSGGSAGKEGPIIQIGSAVGSTVAQKLGLTPYQTKVLVTCGAAGGIAAIFNTPIAGVLFGIELILREVKLRSLTAIIVSAVFATITAQVLLNYLGVEATYIFFLPQYTLKTPVEILFYILLGLVAGLVAILFTKSLYGVENIFERIKSPEFVKPAIGGLFVGVIGLVFFLSVGNPYVFGIGFDTMSLLFEGQIVFAAIFALIFLKIIATSLTLGSGGSGGVFTPALFIGSMTGGAFGTVIHKIFPTITATYEAYAIVGMAAVFAGGSNAILTAIVLVFEMTGNYMIILPVMLACVVSTSFYRFYMEDTIYTVKLRHQGIIIEHEMDVNQMKTIKVKNIMKTDVETVPKELTLLKLSEKIINTGHMAFPVVQGQNNLIGIVTHSDFDKIDESDHVRLKVEDVMTEELITAQPDDTLEDVLVKIGDEELSHFPVVDPENPNKLVGFFTKGDIIRAYTKKRAD
ncbi:MAG: putative voltage-gated ClC-type chloride channel ClcB [Methanobacterium sp. PtaU1.Bin097]|jgi:CIC family chloride channel protein|nr:MAG: putative voltage-gated ClC-type chloride channel ClcB [Methanobacterium sp. PtaU1.Bin097]